MWAEHGIPDETRSDRRDQHRDEKYGSKDGIDEICAFQCQSEEQADDILYYHGDHRVRYGDTNGFKQNILPDKHLEVIKSIELNRTAVAGPVCESQRKIENKWNDKE